MLKGKNAIITGSGRGIGKAIALKLASLGANVVINDIPQSADADNTCEEIKALGVKSLCIKGDVRNIDDVKEIKDLIEELLEQAVLSRSARDYY